MVWGTQGWTHDNGSSIQVFQGPAQLIGLAHVMRECWVLAGFVAQDSAESALIDPLRQRDELGFDPTIHPERLTARSKTAKRCAKRVLSRLVHGNRERETACWRETPLAQLVERGKAVGLSEYLLEVSEKLVPLLRLFEFADEAQDVAWASPTRIQYVVVGDAHPTKIKQSN